MPEKPQDQPDNLGLFKALLTFALHAFTAIGEMSLHVGIGWLYPSPFIRMVAIGLPYGFLLLWAEKVKRQGCPDELAYLALLPTALVALMGVQWIISILVRRRTYSQYTGRPVIRLALPFLGELFVKTWIEPALLMGGSWWFYAWNRPLMSFIFAVGVSMFAVGRLRSLNDMFREQGLIDAYHKPHY